ncbi:class I SAM-dependent methyltransferase [Actinophytocola glycyrrhizae]|uniref:Methyltransferase domain-containing protein n=1 Tax=Actinophytocola glycyrrhizae TaxID=2044873 RepID=A0ABV9SAD3_9PSEU
MRKVGSRAEDLVQRVLTRVGLSHSESRIAADAQTYWASAGSASWKANSHWRDAHVFDDGDLWHEIGKRHLDMFERGARAVGFDRPLGRVVEWGCGGGANAVHFAPKAREFVGVDVVPETLAECARQVAARGGTPFTPVLAEVAHPERVVAEIGTCDLFLCFYLFELIPTPEYGERLLRIASRVLAPGGLALIQVKYHEGDFWSRPRRRGYRTSVAGMTTYSVPEFWQLVADSGLRPEGVTLVPENELDRRYAYFLVSKGERP